MEVVPVMLLALLAPRVAIAIAGSDAMSRIDAALVADAALETSSSVSLPVWKPTEEDVCGCCTGLGAASPPPPPPPLPPPMSEGATLPSANALTDAEATFAEASGEDAGWKEGWGGEEAVAAAAGAAGAVLCSTSAIGDKCTAAATKSASASDTNDAIRGTCCCCCCCWSCSCGAC